MMYPNRSLRKLFTFVWVAESQRNIKHDLLKAVEGKGRFRKLSPMIRDDGISVVGGRAIRWTEVSYNQVLMREHILEWTRM